MSPGAFESAAAIRSMGTSIDTVLPTDVLWAAMRGSAEGAAALGMHLVLEQGAPVSDAARLPESFATVLAWAWRWNQRSALELLATYLGDLRDVLDEWDTTHGNSSRAALLDQAVRHPHVDRLRRFGPGSSRHLLHPFGTR